MGSIIEIETHFGGGSPLLSGGCQIQDAGVAVTTYTPTLGRAYSRVHHD